MGGKEIWGAPEKFYHGAEKTLRDQPMTMNEIKTSLPGNFNQMKKQEEQEKRELQSCEPAWFEFWNNSAIVAKALQVFRVEVGKTDDIHFAPGFLFFRIRGMRDEDLDVNLVGEVTAKIMDKTRFLIIFPSWVGGGYNKNSKFSERITSHVGLSIWGKVITEDSLFIHLAFFDSYLNIFQKLPIYGDEFCGYTHHNNLKADNKQNGG